MGSQSGELEYRLHQQALLAELGRRALSEASLKDLLTEAARLTALGVRSEFCKVLEYLPTENRLLVCAGVGWHDGVVGQATVGADLESPAGYALHTGKPVISNDLSHDDRFRTPALLAEHGVQRAINVILLGEGKPFGVLEADSKGDRAFSEHDLDYLQAVASLLGVAVERRRAQDALRDLNAGLEARVAEEVDQRREAESALYQAQKLEAVGQLTGGVAHDFNNLLMVITGNLDLLSKGPIDDKTRRLVAAAQKGAIRGQQLTSQLLAFARRQALHPETSNVNDLVREFDVLATRLLGDAYDIEFDLAPGAWACHVDAAQLGSTLLNLVLNARDAMPTGGALVIRTRNVALDPAAAAKLGPDTAPGDYVLIDVEDNGVGMPPEVVARATEPFFTTKEVGKGTGLGLSQVYGFVRQSGGVFRIRSAPQAGTCVKIYLPRAAPAAASREVGDPSMPAGSESILVVEDDEDVRNLVASLLDGLGYRTFRARNAPEALQILDGHSDRPVDLLLTDIVMPGGMSGVDLAREVRQRRPNIAVLLMTAYAAADDLVRNAGEDLPILSKPYRQNDLAIKVRDVLDQRRGGKRDERASERMDSRA
jgi:signal transduction histidine kinase/FixJ family two-component response regulator